MVWLLLCEDMLKMQIYPLTAGGAYGTAVIKHYLSYICKQSSCAYKYIRWTEKAFETFLKTVCYRRSESGHENRCASKENSVAAQQAHFSPSSKCVGVYLNVSMKGTDCLLSYLLIAEASPWQKKKKKNCIGPKCVVSHWENAQYIRFPIRQCNMHQMQSLKIFLPFLQAHRFDSESDRVSFGLHVHKAVKHGRLRNSIQLVEILLFSICPFWICKGGLPAHGLTTVIREARWVARHQGFNAEQRLLWQQVGEERKVKALHKGTMHARFKSAAARLNTEHML